MTPTERCPIEGKLRFETRKDAETTIEAWHEEHGWIGRPYYCRSCDGFHLTRNPEPERSPA